MIHNRYLLYKLFGLTKTNPMMTARSRYETNHEKVKGCPTEDLVSCLTEIQSCHPEKLPDNLPENSHENLPRFITKNAHKPFCFIGLWTNINRIFNPISCHRQHPTHPPIKQHLSIQSSTNIQFTSSFTTNNKQKTPSITPLIIYPYPNKQVTSTSFQNTCIQWTMRCTICSFLSFPNLFHVKIIQQTTPKFSFRRNFRFCICKRIRARGQSKNLLQQHTRTDLQG